MDTNFLVKNTFLELKSKFPYYLVTILPFAIIEEFLSSLESVIPSMLFSILVLPF